MEDMDSNIITKQGSDQGNTGEYKSCRRGAIKGFICILLIAVIAFIAGFALSPRDTRYISMQILFPENENYVHFSVSRDRLPDGRFIISEEWHDTGGVTISIMLEESEHSNVAIIHLPSNGFENPTIFYAVRNGMKLSFEEAESLGFIPSGDFLLTPPSGFSGLYDNPITLMPIYDEVPTIILRERRAIIPEHTSND